MCTRECQCEEKSHFDTKLRTPYGNPAHEYGRKFHESALVRVSPSYEICKDCANDCWGGIED